MVLTIFFSRQKISANEFQRATSWNMRKSMKTAITERPALIRYEMMVLFPVPLGAEMMITRPSAFFVTVVSSMMCVDYRALRTCSLICSNSSFIFTTMFCISAWLLLEPVVLISRPIS